MKASGPNSQRGSEGGPGSSDPGQYRFTAATVQDLLAVACNVKYFQISSPTPLDRHTVDLVAKIPPGATKEQFRVMLQNLLIERFAMKMHVEKKDFPAYELVIAKTGAKLKDGVPAGPRKFVGADLMELEPNRPGMLSNNSVSGDFMLVRFRARQQTLAAFASMLRPSDGLTVVDRTGLDGKYDFNLEFTQDPPGRTPDALSDPPVAPSLFTAVQEHLGLQLVRSRVPFDAVIVESFSPEPSAN